MDIECTPFSYSHSLPSVPEPFCYSARTSFETCLYTFTLLLYNTLHFVESQATRHSELKEKK